MASERDGWVRREDEPLWDYWRDGTVLATIEPQSQFPPGRAAPATRWRILHPQSLYETEWYPYATQHEAQREAETRIREDR
jgi:hypothetical protein